MSVLSRVSAPAATHDLAGVVVALFSNPERAAPRNLPGSVGDQLPGNENKLAASVVGRLVTGPTGLGTSAARIHNELMHTFVEEAAVLSQVGSLALRRFLADIWAWLGGNREWHSTTERYHGASKA